MSRFFLFCQGLTTLPRVSGLVANRARPPAFGPSSREAARKRWAARAATLRSTTTRSRRTTASRARRRRAGRWPGPSLPLTPRPAPTRRVSAKKRPLLVARLALAVSPFSTFRRAAARRLQTRDPRLQPVRSRRHGERHVQRGQHENGLSLRRSICRTIFLNFFRPFFPPSPNAVEQPASRGPIPVRERARLSLETDEILSQVEVQRLAWCRKGLDGSARLQL